MTAGCHSRPGGPLITSLRTTLGRNGTSARPGTGIDATSPGTIEMPTPARTIAGSVPSSRTRCSGSNGRPACTCRTGRNTLVGGVVVIGGVLLSRSRSKAKTPNVRISA